MLEVASPRTWQDDLGRKREVYARLGVGEYWQYDPAGTLLPMRLQGAHLMPSGYVRQLTATGPDGALTLRSRVLGPELRAAPGREMRFRDPATGHELPSYDEEAEARAAETEARRAAEARAATAERRVAELEAMLRARSG